MTLDFKLWKLINNSKELESILVNQGIDKDILIFFSLNNCPYCDSLKKIFDNNEFCYNYILREDVLPLLVEKESQEYFDSFTTKYQKPDGFPTLFILDGRNNYEFIGVSYYWVDTQDLIKKRYLELVK